MPHGVRILTLETTNNKNKLLLRLENYFEENENPYYSNTTKVDIRELIHVFEVVSVVETNLSANQLIKDKQAWKWNTKSAMDIDNFHQRGDHSFEITLTPMQIRTFILNVRYN